MKNIITSLNKQKRKKKNANVIMVLNFERNNKMKRLLKTAKNKSTVNRFSDSDKLINYNRDRGQTLS